MARFFLMLRALIAPVLAILVMLAFAGQSSAAQLRGVGLHPQALDHSSSAIQHEFSLLHAAGADSVRFDIAWHSLEWTGKGQEDPGTLAWLDWVMAQAHANGLKVILDVWSTPCWASSAPVSIRQNCSWGWWNRGVMSYPPVHPQDYADFVAFVAKRWASNLAAVELWNEPNGTNGYFFNSPHPGYDYAALVKATYPAVKAVAPRLPVIMSLAGTDTQFLSYLYYWGVRGYYDGIAVHPYYQPTLSGLTGFRTYQLSQGDSTPLWVTEVGWPSNTYGLQGQANRVATVLQQLAGMPFVAAAEIYDMRDAGTDPTNGEDHFGLIDYYMNPKPAWYSFAAELSSLAPPSAAPTRLPVRTSAVSAHMTVLHHHARHAGKHRRHRHRAQRQFAERW